MDLWSFWSNNIFCNFYKWKLNFMLVILIYLGNSGDLGLAIHTQSFSYFRTDFWAILKKQKSPFNSPWLPTSCLANVQNDGRPQQYLWLGSEIPMAALIAICSVPWSHDQFLLKTSIYFWFQQNQPLVKN